LADDLSAIALAAAEALAKSAWREIFLGRMTVRVK
jgi:hypothetical protein